MIEREIIEAYALENAVRHGGKAFESPILNSLFSVGLEKDKIKNIIPEIQGVIKEVNSLSPDEQKERYEELKDKLKKREHRQGIPPLPGAKDGEVMLRFAPFPSGPLHIGNSRQLILNDEYARKYNGKLILVMDDTIGSIDKPIEDSAYKLIKEGADWLDVNYKKIIYKSGRLRIYYDYAKKLIEKGYMYVCSCTQDEIRDLRKRGIECGCRNLPEEEQLKRWKSMFKAKPGDFTVRLKTSMQYKNPAFRDRVMFKISDKKHPRTNDKYRVWPLMEFSWAIDDHLLRITHIIRGIDLIMESKVERFIWDIFHWKKPVIIHTGSLAIQGIRLSKSKGAREVKSGEYIGWNDPRTWSLQSLRDRGIVPEALRGLILLGGITRNNSTIAVDVLYTLNRKYLEKVPRYFFVPNPIKIRIKGSPKLKAVLSLHSSEPLGDRVYETTQEFYIPQEDAENMVQGNYRLMHLLNFKTDFSPVRGRDYSFISEDPDNNLGVKYIQWLPADTDNIKVIVRMPDNSIIKGLGEPELLNLRKGQEIQFERFGFVKLYKLDKRKKKAEFWFSHR